jgi:acyl-coenzyme A thioesterase PaaI-like protein
MFRPYSCPEVSITTVRPDTARRDAGLGARLLASWQRLSRLPAGRWLFSRAVGRFAPYSGSIGARVESLEPGRAVVTLRESRRVRNHLRSVHAIALANLGELCSGLAAMSALPAGVRGIPDRIEIDYLKKARGTLTATGSADMPYVQDHATTDAVAEIHDAGGDLVCVVRVRWQLERVGA